MPLVCALTGALACDSHSADPNHADVLLVGTNDEALAQLLGMPAKQDPAQTLVFDAPTDGDLLSEVPTFAWHLPDTTLAPTAPGAPRSTWQWSDLLVTPAHAHGITVQGKAYLLVVASADNTKLLRVFTHAVSYRPDTAAWARVTAGGGPRTATLTLGKFENGELTGGAFAGKPVTFQVK